MQYIVVGRPMLSRASEKSIGVVGNLVPGKNQPGCFVCCSAPSFLPLCSWIIPCCGDAEYIKVRREASKYVYIRENSLEWNEPTVILQRGPCFGIDPCLFEVQDHVTVLYYDDPMFDRITDQTRLCNECKTCICGGKGERIRIDSPCCFNLCLRSACPCPLVPICCPSSFCPCVLRHEIYLEDAQKGMYEIRKARRDALAQDSIVVNENCEPQDIRAMEIARNI